MQGHNQISAIFLSWLRTLEDLEIPVYNYSKGHSPQLQRTSLPEESPSTLLQLCLLITCIEIRGSSFQCATNRNALNRRKVPFFLHSRAQAGLLWRRQTRHCLSNASLLFHQLFFHSKISQADIMTTNGQLSFACKRNK